MTNLPLDEMEAALDAATPGEWEADTEYDPDAYACGHGGTTTGFNDYVIFAGDPTKPVRIADTVNSDCKIVHDEYDGQAWDEVGRANAHLICLTVNSLPSLIAAARERDALVEAVSVAQGDLHMLKIAIKQGDPRSELLVRAIDTEADLRNTLEKTND